MSIFKKKTYKSIIGIAYDHNVLTLSLLSVNGNGIRVQQSIRTEMALDLFSGEPELVGQELRNHLQQAGISEYQCVVSVQVQWLMSQSIELPNLSKEDENNFIALHSEREFPYPAQDLSTAVSKYLNQQDKQYAFISAMPLRQIKKLKAVFQAAKLQLISVTVGVAHFDFDKNDVQLILQQRAQGTDCFIVSGKSVYSVRHISHMNDEYDEDPVYIANELKRELRITLGQLPSEIRNTLREVQLFGSETWNHAVKNVVPALPGCSSVTINDGNDYQQKHLNTISKNNYVYAAATGAAYTFLKNQQSSLEYLPPYVSRIERIFMQVSSKRNMVVGQAAAAVAFLLVVVFGYQHWTYTNLSSNWTDIEDQVTEVDEIQQKVKQFRPWFNKNIPSLNALKALTELFPEEGSIWVKSVQIENESFITLSGFANNNQVLSDTMDLLNENESVEALQMKQVSGQSPIQYSLQFSWIGG